MNESTGLWIEFLESAWNDPNGVLVKARDGEFSPVEGKAFVERLRRIEIGPGSEIDRRLVSLLWYLPQFLEWQTERVTQSDPTVALPYMQFSNAVLELVSNVLGVPFELGVRIIRHGEPDL
jgi:hypothetical protein